MFQFPQSCTDVNGPASGMLALPANWVRLALNDTNLGLLKMFQYILAHRAKMYWNLILQSSRFVLFGANLTQFGADPDTPDPHNVTAATTTTTRRLLPSIAAYCHMLHSKFSSGLFLLACKHNIGFLTGALVELPSVDLDLVVLGAEVWLSGWNAAPNLRLIVH